MLHDIPAEKFGPQGEDMAKQVKACVHCGFCLPVCPTYKALGEEMDSPRGRIYLMKGVLEGELDLDEAIPFIDKCLGCMACVPVCPSGVEYGELLTPFRNYSENQRKRNTLSRVTRFMLRNVLPYPARFRSAIILGRLAKPFRHLMPGQLGAMLELLPETLPKADPLPEIQPARGERRARVALLAGCAQQVLSPKINRATLRVLAENGVEVVVPKNQNCCGALSMHSGEGEQALKLARGNFQSFPRDVDAIITNAAGCGSGMKEYPLIFKGLPEEQAARDFTAKVQDVSVFLDQLGLKSPPPLKQSLKVAYHDACHLAHAQGVQAAPRRILTSISNLDLAEIPDGEFCCGSAGTYNLEQPEIARRLGREKAENIMQTGSQAIATGNIGCITQIETHLKTLGHPLPVYHTLEVLDLAYSEHGRN